VIRSVIALTLIRTLNMNTVNFISLIELSIRGPGYVVSAVSKADFTK